MKNIKEDEHYANFKIKKLSPEGLEKLTNKIEKVQEAHIKVQEKKDKVLRNNVSTAIYKE